MSVDFDALVNATAVATFGVAAGGGAKWNYMPQTGAAFGVDGIFDEAFRSLELSTGRVRMAISTTGPRFGVRQKEFPAGVSPKRGDTIADPVSGRAFEIADVQPDGFSYFYLTLVER